MDRNGSGLGMAVEFLRRQPADQVVLNMIMAPGIDGYETYRQIRSIRPEQKAIIASGYSETERVRGAQALGAGSYIKKPYTLAASFFSPNRYGTKTAEI